MQKHRRQTAPPLKDEFPNQCTRLIGGYRCQNDGHIIRGATGGKLCRECFEALESERLEDSGISVAIDQRVHDLYVPRLESESLHDWSMRCRVWCLEKIRRGLYRQIVPDAEPEALQELAQEEPGANG